MRRTGEFGASAVEYAMMVVAVGLFAVVAYGFVHVLGDATEAEVCDKDGYACCAPDRDRYEGCPEQKPPA